MPDRLAEYARLLVEVGLNIQKGQRLVLSSPVECAEFARLCASAAYDAGCAEVVTNWSDDHMTREKYLRAEEGVFDVFPAWRGTFYEDYSKEGAAFLSLYCTDPENLKGVSPDRIRRSEIAAGAALEAYRRRQTRNEFQWCIGSLPTRSWAGKVFPDKTPDEAVKALWDAIFATVRVTGDGGAVGRWREHIARLSGYKQKLMDYNFKKLHYKNSLGTDLVVELPEDHIWEAGSERTPKGWEFVANMPTEEVFTAPKRDGVNGVVVASKPLAEAGNIIENFRMELKNGRIVHVEAEKGEEFLKNAVSVDEGAAYLGEAALVPYDSPISNSGILFFNTLFDENASCHLAFGEAYPCVRGSADMTKEELRARGLNDSITHVDFMIGTPDLSIVGTTHDGREIEVFKDGNFGF